MLAQSTRVCSLGCDVGRIEWPVDRRTAHSRKAPDRSLAATRFGPRSLRSLWSLHRPPSCSWPPLSVPPMPAGQPATGGAGRGRAIGEARRPRLLLAASPLEWSAELRSALSPRGSGELCAPGDASTLRERRSRELRSLVMLQDLRSCTDRESSIRSLTKGAQRLSDDSESRVARDRRSLVLTSGEAASQS